MELAPVTGKTAKLVQEVANASRDQAAGLAQVNKVMGEVNYVVQRHTSRVEELTGASDELATLAQGLQKLMGRFKTKGGQSQIVNGLTPGSRASMSERASAAGSANPAEVAWSSS